MYYKNFNPISGSTIDNLSYFTHCKFQTDDNHPSDYPFNTHVSMWGVDRIAIKGCSFSNLKTNLTDPLAMGVGINTIDAYLVVRNAITHPLIGGDFFGLTYGIRVQNSSAIFNSQIFQSTFNENTTGIFIQNSNNSQITYNNFTIGTLPISTLDPYTSIVGVGVDRSSQFDFSHNQFYGSHNGMKHVVGQWFTNTSTSDFSENVSISNKFSGISYGTLANYVNKHEDPITHAVSGLQFRRNINTSNTRDFTAYSGTSASIFGIRDNQGSLTNYAGNTFSTHLGTSPLYHHYDNEELNRLFYFVTGPGSIDYPSYPGRPAYFIYRNGAAIGQCPPVIYGTGTSPVGGVFDPAHRLSSSEKDALSASFLSHKNELDGYKSILQSLIDGGDTTLKEQTKFYSSNANTTRSKLLEASPYLSKEVLKEAAFNTEIPDEVLFEILLANPSSAKDDTLMSYLKSGTHNLPDWMVELIENNLNTVTAKSLLELAVSDARENMMSDWRQIYTDVLNDTIGIDHSALRGWLGLLNDIEADYMIVDDLIEQGDYTDADTFMTEIPQNYKLTDNQMDEYDAMLAFNKWRLSVLKNEHSYMKLSTQEKDQLIEMAEAKESSAQKRAQSILNFFYGYNYETYPEFPTEISQRRGAVSETGKNTYSRGTSGIKLYPNPAINTLSIEVNLPKVDKALNLIFTDILGNTVWESHFQTTEFQSTIDVRNWSSGMYRYQLKSNGELLAEGKVIISR
jgi:Secretion system C-terminal sorting domain